MVLKALDKYGYNDLAYDIASNYLDNVVSVFNRDGTIYENYAPEYIERGSHSQPKFVGWTGLSPINIVFEYVFGIRPDAQNKKIVWHINRLERHGIKNYPLGDSFIDLICEDRKSIDEIPKIIVNNHSDSKITIEFVCGNNVWKEKF